MGRTPCCAQVGLKRGRWTAEEDEILTKYIQTHGEGSWRDLPKNAGLLRCGKSCRLRWINYLRLDLRRGNISAEEEELIIKLHGLLGNRWSQIAGRLPGRTDNEIKNYWNTHLSRKLGDRGIDPVTHKPFYQSFSLQTKTHAKSEQNSSINTSKESADTENLLEKDQPTREKSVVITGTFKRKKDYQDKGAPRKKKATTEKHSSVISSQSTLESCSENIPNESELKILSHDCSLIVEEECGPVQDDEHPTSSFTENSLNLWDETFSSSILPYEMDLFGSFDTDDLLMFDDQLAVSNAADDNSYNMEDTADDLWCSFLSNMEPSDYP
ncbi:hypothetical protein SUGI_0120700 [Cryptomeria japonica]|uniref:myb-related protein 308 n=1 Tax=Cryptomeria japonica TaxID=3369 RepID=UPI002408BFAA|nr:myb-related protein 308 [Cryptomeria japonica]GLJ10040.1 hypothetical protein SUGI_0120700 [Cryptomeria japonica]